MNKKDFTMRRFKPCCFCSASNNSRRQEAIIKHKSYHILKREWWDYKQGLESLNLMLQENQRQLLEKGFFSQQLTCIISTYSHYVIKLNHKLWKNMEQILCPSCTPLLAQHPPVGSHCKTHSPLPNFFVCHTAGSDQFKASILN